MSVAYKIVASLVALLHVWFLVLEMFLWTTPLGLKTFRMSLEKAQVSEALAKNMGLYNGFLAAGIIWGLVSGNHQVGIFFLVCVIIAGIFGAMTASPKILFIQALPALIALLLLIGLIKEF